MPNDMPHPSPSIAAEDTRSVFDRVFGTYELCENILKHLEPDDLLRTRRTCRATESLVRDSINLQRKLFLTPTNEPNDTWHVDKATQLVHGPAPKEQKLRENTFVCTYNPLIMVCNLAYHGLQGCSCSPDLTCRTYQLNFDPASLLEGSSCEAMFLTQPPTIRVAWDSDFGLSGSIRGTEGVRFKDLIKDVDSAAKARGVESSKGLKTLSLMFQRDCAVTAEQRLFVERKGVVAREADPWLLGSKGRRDA
ncbi:hypothetical protein LTR97_009812 [Elasticomyces elasticus]|uniref:F-box domain-containing protein n=1 Tax=Elasticomyces elasticus TaxID=574655 RepID=A0AAN7VP61_9PEZI|nr:hypothetical protein LTR97_009812 [Elasticomyces elasticus]